MLQTSLRKDNFNTFLLSVAYLYLKMLNSCVDPLDVRLL